MPASERRVAYFSMEVGLDPSFHTYSGGLGILSGDTIRAAADMGLPMVAVSLVHRQGYFRQTLDGEGRQTEEPAVWAPEKHLERVEPRVSLLLEGRTVQIRAWRHEVVGHDRGRVPVYLLDTDLPENHPNDQGLTDQLYGGDGRYRLAQEIVLGLGGPAMLRALGHLGIQVFHLNEGHSALLALDLWEQASQDNGARAASELQDRVRRHCVFTTHTPVPAGHDQHPVALVETLMGRERLQILEQAGCVVDGSVNMTRVALAFSRYVNGVSMRHQGVSQEMFPHFPIDAVTNGVHAATWASRPFRALFDRYFPEWRRDNLYLRYAMDLPAAEIQAAHRAAKQELLNEVRRRSGVDLSLDRFTIGFARRATPYKRADLVFSDLDRLGALARDGAPLQIIYAGKAHPRDQGGKDLIRRIFAAGRDVSSDVRVVYLPDYDMPLAKFATSGVDLWLNTPQRPQEASGTSGMKAALNGVPSLSVHDGWWVEGAVEGVTGWTIGSPWRDESDIEDERRSLYDKLEKKILPLFRDDPAGWAEVMRWCIALNGSFFNTQRMLTQYVQNAYRLDAAEAPAPSVRTTAATPT